MITTPIYDFVQSYIASNPVRLHMPGHKGTGPLGCEYRDLTEITGADVLYHAQGIIRESEKNAAALFGSGRTLYSTEGSSLPLRAMLYLALLDARARGRAPRILAGRNAHKTLLTGAALLGLEVDWLYPGDGSLLSCTVTTESLEAALSERNYTAVFVTSPDYLGNLADIAGLARVCHAHGCLLLVDNAHGAYLRFLPEDRHPLTLGADLCCDSAHKTLPVLTGGGYLHLSKDLPPELCEAAESAMDFFASTSPSYLILQSLDLANRTLSETWPGDLAACCDRIAALKKRLQAAGWTVLGDEPLKLTLAPKDRGYTGTDLGAYLESRSLFPEYADPDRLVLMLTPANTPEDLARLEAALTALPPKAPILTAPPPLVRAERVLSPREALLSPSETLPLAECLGRILAAPTVSCPPAVPVAVSGERLDEAALSLLDYYGYKTCRVL